jgi:PAS domain-containing protein
VFEVLSHVPLAQPAAVVSAVGETIAVNEALVDLLGGAPGDYVTGRWAQVMPAWPELSGPLPGLAGDVIEAHLRGAGGRGVWARVTPAPIPPTQGPAPAFLLYISRPDAEAQDRDELRRLRKSRDILAGVDTDYVVEVDADGFMTFVSPSFCRAVGAPETELVGRPFLTRVCADDRDATAMSLRDARRAPFCGEMSARLAADGATMVQWQIEGVIGDGIACLDLIGRPRRA